MMHCEFKMADAARGRTMWKCMFDQNEGFIYLVWHIFVGSNAYWWPRYVSECKKNDDNRYFVCGERSVSTCTVTVFAPSCFELKS